MNFSELYESLTPPQRVELAKRAGTDPGYLWQIANQWRGRRPSIDLLKRLADADSRLRMASMVDEFAREPQ